MNVNARINYTHSQRKTNGSISKHNNTLIEATRQFSILSRPSAHEIIIFKELFYELINRLEPHDRRVISAMLARCHFTPRAIALYFSQDDLAIAAPFLLFSPVLGERDLLAISDKMGEEYKNVILKRQLPVDSRIIDRLNGVTKPEIEEEKPASIAEYDASQEWLSGEEILALAGIGGRMGRSEGIQRKSISARSQDQSIEINDIRKLQSFARIQNFQAMADLIEEFCGLKSEDSIKLLRKSKKDELVYLVKALGIQAPHDLQLMLMLAPETGRDIATYREVKTLLADLDIGVCRMIFNEIGANFEMKSKTAAISRPSDQFNSAARLRREGFGNKKSEAELPVDQTIQFQKLAV